MKVVQQIGGMLFQSVKGLQAKHTIVFAPLAQREMDSLAKGGPQAASSRINKPVYWPYYLLLS